MSRQIAINLALLIAAVGTCSLPAHTIGESVTGIENFEKVDSHVYRGAQPGADGYKYLAGLGVKTVIDLREADHLATSEQAAVEANGMRFINVPMTGFTPPTADEINRILAVLEDQTSGPVFVHCKRGADRTGAVIAAYHIDHDKWDNAHALSDAKAHDMSSFQLPRQAFIKSFQARPVVVTAAPAPAPTSNN